MAEYLIQDTTLTDIADAIREKLEITDTMTPEQMPAKIRLIKTETVTSGHVTYDLDDGLICINASTKAYGNYSTTIIANSGYNIDSITVFMGGTNITSTAYVPISATVGVIFIENVTGSIAITAYAR